MPRVTDPRRADLALPYVHRPEKTESGSSSSIFSSTLPMAGMFLRSKLVSWCAFFTALQQYLNEPTNKPASESGQPAWISLGSAIIGLMVSYMDFVFMRPVPQAPK